MFEVARVPQNSTQGDMQKKAETTVGVEVQSLGCTYWSSVWNRNRGLELHGRLLMKPMCICIDTYTHVSLHRIYNFSFPTNS